MDDLVTEFFRAFDERIAPQGWLESATASGPPWIPPGSDQIMMDIDRSMRSTLANAEARHEEMGVIARTSRTSRSGTSNTSRWTPRIEARIWERR